MQHDEDTLHHKSRVYEGWVREETMLKRANKRGRTEGEGGSI